MWLFCLKTNDITGSSQMHTTNLYTILCMHWNTINIFLTTDVIMEFTANDQRQLKHSKYKRIFKFFWVFFQNTSQKNSKKYVLKHSKIFQTKNEKTYKWPCPLKKSRHIIIRNIKQVFLQHARVTTLRGLVLG